MSDTEDQPMTPVRSSNVAAVGTSGGDLLVQFHSGKTYVYAGQASHYDTMVQSASPGRYLFQNLPKGVEV